MNKLFTASSLNLLIIASLVTTPSFANSEKPLLTPADKIKQAQANEEIGFGTGALIGAIFGGPIGAFITGITGNLLAKQFNADEKITDLASELTRTQDNNQQSINAYENKLKETEQLYQQELFTLAQNYKKNQQLQAENLLMSLQFKTGSSVLEPHYHEQIAALAKMLQHSLQLSIDLSGYTDLLGDKSFNKTLSIARVEAVKNALINEGIASERIKLYAFGEEQPVVASMEKESSFYDRRVVIKLRAGEGSDHHTASNN